MRTFIVVVVCGGLLVATSSLAWSQWPGASGYLAGQVVDLYALDGSGNLANVPPPVLISASHGVSEGYLVLLKQPGPDHNPDNWSDVVCFYNEFPVVPYVLAYARLYCNWEGWPDLDQGLVDSVMASGNVLWMSKTSVAPTEYTPVSGPLVIGPTYRVWSCEPVSIPNAKRQDNDVVVAVGGKVVTYSNANFFYIEEDNRFCGIRVESMSHGLAVGMRADVLGSMKTNANRERYILATKVAQTAPPNAFGSTAPVAVVNGALGGADWCVSGTGGQSGVTGSSGLNNLGLLVRTWGRITQVGPDYLYIDDGSGVRDGTYTNDQENIGVHIAYDPLPYNLGGHIGEHVGVTGISSCFLLPDRKVARRVLTRGLGDLDGLTAKVGGKVTLSGYLADPSWILLTVELRAPGSTSPLARLTTSLDAQGNYVLPKVPLGTYDLAYRCNYTLRKVVPNVNVSGDLSGRDVTLIYGDLKEECLQIGMEDWGVMFADWGTNSRRSDLNGDGTVDTLDWNILYTNWGAVSDP